MTKMTKILFRAKNEEKKNKAGEENSEQSVNPNPVIALRDVWKTYRTGAVQLTALRGISVQIFRGEFTAIMGPSGSGKSTMMNILGCLDQMDSGSYFLNDTDISNLSQNQLAFIRNQEIGFVFQSFNLLTKITLQENVELPLVYAGLGRRERAKRAAEALEAVGLLSWARHRPNEVSGGQIQRAAIARAIVMRPALLMADEPTGNLDSRTSLDIMEVFSQLNKNGSTIVLITHEKDIASFANRIVRVEDGEIVFDSFGRDAPGPGKNH